MRRLLWCNVLAVTFMFFITHCLSKRLAIWDSIYQWSPPHSLFSSTAGIYSGGHAELKFTLVFLLRPGIFEGQITGMSMSGVTCMRGEGGDKPLLRRLSSFFSFFFL